MVLNRLPVRQFDFPGRTSPLSRGYRPFDDESPRPKDHHDLEIEDETGRWLERPGCPEGLEGITKLHALVAEHAPADWSDLPGEEVTSRVFVGIETDRGPWVTALRAARLPGVAINTKRALALLLTI